MIKNLFIPFIVASSIFNLKLAKVFEDKYIDDLLLLIKKEKYDKTNRELSKFKHQVYFSHLTQYIKYKQLNFEKPLIELNEKTNYNDLAKIFYLLNSASINFYKLGDELSAFKELNLAYKLSKKTNSKQIKVEILRSILNLYEIHSDITNDKTYLFFLNNYKGLLLDYFEKTHYNYYCYRLPQRYLSKNQYKFSVDSVNILQKNIEKLNHKYLLAKFYITKATLYFHYLDEGDKAHFYLKKAKSVLNNPTNKLHKERFLAASLNQAGYYINDQKFKKAQKVLANIKFSDDNYLTQILMKFYFIRKWNLFIKTDNDSAIHYKAKYFEQELKINHQKSLTEISKLKSLEKENENIKLKADKLEVEAKNKQQKNLIIGSILFIVLGGTIATLTLQNSKRKRKLAEQQKEIETQKNLTLIKEQEITTINAMVEGQEKERKRVAEDLHDNLGSVLATLKLHFENLKINREKKKINQEELFDKTENLIDEAYLKVRKIAHAKNAGVIANQGLLAAVQMMAEKISSAEKLKIEVVDFGLDKRLENTLEIAVFRIIQELTTNIIKHAEATLATIQISLFDQTLNIIIEDNGKGFNPKKLQLKSGIGISSIKTRIEHLEGTFEIDSTIGKGSTFILNIPVA